VTRTRLMTPLRTSYRAQTLFWLRISQALNIQLKRTTLMCLNPRVVGVAVIFALIGCSQPESGETTSPAWFVEEAAQRGLDFEHRSGFAGRALLPEIVGGGAALADVDGDGDVDAYLVQSGWNLQTGPDANTPGNRLYLNRGDGYFDAANQAGDVSDRGYGMGVAAGDYDNDGDVDLYVTNLGANALLQNDGSGRFENVASAAGVDDPGWSTAAAFLDLDNDDDLDLFVVNYLNWSPGVEKDCSSRGRPTYCAPTTYDSPAMDRLYRNDGDGTFTDVTVEAGLNRGFGNGLGTVGADFNGDGLIDLFVANDRTLDQLWINHGGLRFNDAAAEWGCAVDDNGFAKAGMGVAASDIDNDGDSDLLVVNFQGETDSFYRNEGHYFLDATARVGIAMASRRRTRFGVALADFDNDGRLDLYEVNGKVDGDPATTPDPFAEANALFRGRTDDGVSLVFEELSPPGGVAPGTPYTSRALAVGDVDDDGGLDLLVVNRDGPVHLLMNRVANRGKSVQFRVVLNTGGDALGARVSGRVGSEYRHQTVRVAASYLSSHDPRVHFGLGSESTLRDVTVRWPDGSSESFGDFQAAPTADLRRGTGRPDGKPQGQPVGLPDELPVTSIDR